MEELDINFRGAKLTKYPIIQQQVVSWCYDNPKISDYEISKKLKEKYGLDLSSPSVKSWRKNFLPDLIKDLKHQLLTKQNKDEDLQTDEYTYIDYIKKYQSLLSSVDEAAAIVDSVRKNRLKTNEEGNFVYLDQILERTYQDYIKIKTELFEKLLKYVPKDSPWKIAEEVMQECSIGAVLALASMAEDPKYSELIVSLKNEFKKVEVKLRDKYFITI